MSDLAEPSQKIDIGRRIAVTLAALAVYRLGEWVPLPGLDLSALMTEFRPGELSSTLHRMSIFALGVSPMLSALIPYELAKTLVPPFARWESAGLHRREDVQRWLLLLALGFAAFQGNGIAVALESIGGLVPDPGLAFRLGCVASFVAATALILWLASLIDRFGIGSGFWILLAAPLLAMLPRLLQLQHDMWGPASSITGMLMLAMLLVASLVLVALSKTDTSLVPSGQLLWPPILAYVTASFLYVPVLLTVPPERIDAVVATMKTGHPVRLGLVAALTILFSILRYRGLPKGKGQLPPLVPAAAIAAIATAGDFLVSSLALPLMLDGRSLIIIIAVALSVLTAAKHVREH